MKKIRLGSTELQVSQVGLGCMRMADLSVLKATNILKTALEQGINFFDHADIYGSGQSERVFSEAVKTLGVKREDIVIQSKCGIRDGFYDFSKEHILSSVEGILERLETDYIDVLALHRPDALMEPRDVAEAFSILKEQGKVKHFGVSNFSPLQIELLQKELVDPLVVNQLQFGLKHANMVAYSMNTNMENEAGINRDGGVLDYARLHDITVQAWSPYQYGYFDGTFVDNPAFEELNDVLGNIATKYGVTRTGIATAWINRHPANIQTLVGTMTPARLQAIGEASDIVLTREEWYELYQAADYKLL